MASVKKEITNGVFWIGVAKYSGIVVQLFISAILARLISPSAFGTIAVAVVLLYFFNILADIGIGPAVVQYKQLTKQQLNSLFTLTVYIGIVLSVAFYFLSGTIANYYEDSMLERVCQMIAFVILFQSLNVVPNSLMRKDKHFRIIALSTLFFQVVSGVIAVWGAFHEWGIYALLVAPILSSIGVLFVNYYYYPLRLVIRMNREAIRMVASFSFFQFAFSFCNYFSRNLDKLIIGKYFSLTQLGYYDKSYHLMMLPIQNVAYVMEPVLHPVLSSLQNDKHELKIKNQKLAVLISNISFPIGLILFFCGEELVKIIYGDQWDAAIPVFRILALSLPLQMILSTNVPIFQAAGKTNHLFVSGMLNTFCTVSGFIIAAHLGRSIEAVAWSWDITLVINFVNTYFILHYFTLKGSVWSYYSALFPQLINSLLTGGILMILLSIIQVQQIVLSLVCKSSFICLLTIAFAAVLKQYNVANILRMLSGLTKRIL